MGMSVNKVEMYFVTEIEVEIYVSFFYLFFRF